MIKVEADNQPYKIIKTGRFRRGIGGAMPCDKMPFVQWELDMETLQLTAFHNNYTIILHLNDASEQPDAMWKIYPRLIGAE